MKIVELVKLIAPRPTMYFGERSIYSLCAFIDGYLFALEDDADSGEFMRGFQNWIQKRYKISTSQSWARIIAFFSSDEAEALDEAIQLLLEYDSELTRKAESRKRRAKNASGNHLNDPA